MTAVDFIGFGGSGSLQEAFSVDDYARWLGEFLALVKLEKPHVIAHSFGCRVAVKLASNNPSAFDKILLTGPAGVILKRSFSYRAKVAAYRLVKRVFPAYAERNFGSQEYRGLSPIMKESYKKIVNEDLRAGAARVENEVLIVEGKLDTVTTAQEAKAYVEAFPKATLRTMDGGHFAFVEHPLTFNLIVEEFFYV